MTERQCPLCGGALKDNEAICNNCLDNTHKRDSIDFLVGEDDLSSKPQPEVNQDEQTILADTAENKSTISPVNKKPSRKLTKKEKRLFFAFFLGLFICLAIGTVLFVTNKNLQRDKDAELTYWFGCIEENTPLSYSKYLLAYPEGKFSMEARSKIAELRKSESDQWQNLKKSSDWADYRQFLDLYPTTPFKNDIVRMMDSLSWQKASEDNTAESYQIYLENIRLGNISGYYKGVAEERYNYLSKIKELNKEEAEKVNQSIESFFMALSAQNYDKVADQMNTHVTNFYGVTNYTSDVILRTIASDMEKNDINKMAYTPDFSSAQAFRDGNGLYVVQLYVNKNIQFKAKKKEETIREKLHIDLTPDMKIKSMYTVNATGS